MESITFNYLAIIVSAFASFVLGGVYVKVFSKQLANLSGFTNEETRAKQNANPKGLIGIFLANFAMAFGIAYFVSALNIVSISSSLWLIFWMFVGFVGPLTIGPVLWEGKSIKWWVFNNVINIVCLFVMTLILVFWK